MPKRRHILSISSLYEILSHKSPASVGQISQGVPKKAPKEDLDDLPEQESNRIVKLVNQGTELILECFRTSGYSNVYLSFNGGKESVVALHLYRIARDIHKSEEADFNLPLQGVYFNNLGPQEFPEIANFIDLIKKRYEMELR